jgi:hypothetical protein
MLDKLKKITNKLTLITLVIYLVTIIPNISMNIAQANTYGDGSAGDVTITNTRNISTFSNKNFRNLTIDGGTLVVDQVATIYVQQNLVIKNGGKITSSNGADGYNYYDNYYEIFRSMSPTNGTDIIIYAQNININSNGHITTGKGGKGHPYYSGSYGRWSGGSGANSGNLTLFFDSLDINNSQINTGPGGEHGDGVMTDCNSGSGGSSGQINLNGINIRVTNNGLIQTGNGFKGNDAYVYYNSVAAGNGGNSGTVNISNSNYVLIDSTSSIKTGVPGNPGRITAHNYSGSNRAGTGGNAGIPGTINFTNCGTIDIHGSIQPYNGVDATYDSYYYNYSYPVGKKGGTGGSVNITGPNTILNVYGSGRILSGNGGKGGSVRSLSLGGSGPSSGLSGGEGGDGGNITLSIKDLNLYSGAVIKTGDGNIGGDGGTSGNSSTVSYRGGAGGKGGTLTLSVNNSLSKPANEYNLVTGKGGDGGKYAHGSYSGEDNVFYNYGGGHGGKGGNFVLNLPSTITVLSIKLAEIGAGGKGANIDYDGGAPSSTGYYRRTYSPGTGGSPGDLIINASSDLTLNGSQIYRINNSGMGNVFDFNSKYGTNIKSENGSCGNVTLNIQGSLVIASNEAIFMGDMIHNGYAATNNSKLTINASNVRFDSSRPIKWSNAGGGTLELNTVLNNLIYGHNQFNTFFKDSGQSIGKYIYKFTHNSVQGIFKDIPQDHFQVSQDVSFNLEETLYNKILFLFANVKRYKSEDNGTNWQEIITVPMTKDWTWNAPATVKGNSRLKIGIIPYGYSSPEIQEIWINGKQLNTFWTPTQTNPPVIVSNTFAILDTDVGAPVVTLDVNKGETLTTNKILNLNIFAVDNVTPAHILKYSVSHNDGKGVENIPYSQISNYQYDLGKYYTNNQPPSGFYKITVKVIDENFNTGVASKTIYYLRPEDVPATPQPANTVSGNNPNGFALREKSGAEIVGQIKDNKLIYNANKNTLELDLTANTNPYYQVRIGESDFGRIYNKTDVRKLNLPPGEGYHLVGIRSLTADKAPGEETEFYVIVDNTPPVVDISVNNKASIITGDSVQLTIKAKDNIYSQDELVYSYDKSTWQPIPANGTITRSLAATGLVTITVYVKDPSGNIGEAIIKIWKK